MTANRKRIAIGAVVVAGLAAGGTAVATATGGDDGDGTPITGSALDRASAVALEHTGGGKVTATEVGDEEGYYEVEVKRADGSQLDVHLDRDFKVLGAASDGEGDEGEDGHEGDD